jgi:hypothetical protein
MKTAIGIMILAGIVTFTVAAEPQKIDLPKSGSVILTSSVGENAFQYEVLLKKATGQEIKLSSVKVLAPRGVLRCARFLDRKAPESVHEFQQTTKALHPRVQGPGH